MTVTDGGKPTRECAGCGKAFTPNNARQRFHSAACRKKGQAKPEPEETPEHRVIQWATAHGAPVKMLIGWDPDTGMWDPKSPVGEMLGDLAHGAHIVVTGRRHGFHDMTELMYKGSEYAGASEDRSLIPIEVRPLVDLYHRVNYHESGAELDLSKSTYKKALGDGKLGLDFLGRRWPSRWREQQQISSLGEADERAAAISALVADPVHAMALAKMASTIEDQVEETERAKA